MYTRKSQWCAESIKYVELSKAIGINVGTNLVIIGIPTSLVCWVNFEQAYHLFSENN